MSKSKQYSKNLHSYLSAPMPMDQPFVVDPIFSSSTPTSTRRTTNNNTTKSQVNNQPHLSSSNWSLASSIDSAERASLSSLNSSVNMGSNHHQYPSISDQTAPCQRHDLDLLTRTPWVDAETALLQIESGKAQPNKRSKQALILRAVLQARFASLGHMIHRKAGLVLIIGLLVLITFAALLKSATIETNVEKLWVETGGRLEKEMQYVRKTLGDDHGSTNEIVIQTPQSPTASVLHPKAMLYHLEALKKSLRFEMMMFNVIWRWSDICYKPSSIVFENNIDSFLEKFIPCSIITPLDCFWEGSQLLGPEFPVNIPVIGAPVSWTSLNPEMVVEIMESSVKASKTNAEQTSGSSSGNQYMDRSIAWSVQTISKFMKQSGITSGYQKRPCLDPSSDFCPSTAPNYKSESAPNVGAELTGGCFGFATKYMHWPEDMIIGGIRKNKTGHIVNAKALQTIVQLMGAQNLYEFHQGGYKVHNIDWSVDKARMVLEAWQRQFVDEMNRFAEEADNQTDSVQQAVHIYTSSSLMDIMHDFSNVNYVHLTIGCVAMMMFVGITLSKKKVDRSFSILGMAGVLLFSLSIASGLGVCALIELPFNALTTQILPFFTLVLPVYNMFIFIDAFGSDYIVNNVQYQSRTAEALKQTSTSIMISIICNVIAFLCASIIPIPALRCFCFQASIMMLISLSAVIILFPAMASIYLAYRQKCMSMPLSNETNQPSSCLLNFIFLVCCCGVPKNLSRKLPQHSASSQTHKQQHDSSLCANNATNSIYPSAYIQPYNYYYLNSISQRTDKLSTIKKSSSLDSGINHFGQTGNNGICRCQSNSTIDSAYNSVDTPYDSNEQYRLMKKCSSCGGDVRTQCEGQDDQHMSLDDSENYDSLKQLTEIEMGKPNKRIKCSFNYFIRKYYVPLLSNKPMKVLILLTSVGMIAAALLGSSKVYDGLDLTDIVPRDTAEHQFFQFHKEYFSFFQIYAVTKGNFDYPNNQKLLYEYHQSFTSVSAIIKNDDGGAPDFWLSMFRDWLLNLQEAFDRDWMNGAINQESWYSNASVDGVLAYRLMIQTGKVDNPIDKSLLITSRLVDEQGIINPKAFYNYLTAWVHVDALGYSTSDGNFHPDPLHRRWSHDPYDKNNLKIPKAQPLVFTQMPFYLNNIRSTGEITDTIKQIRAICQRFEDRQLPNFPMGNPFTYWEQYVQLRYYLITALVVALVTILATLALFLLNPLTATIVVAVLFVNVIELYGLMGWMNIQLSAIPAVILIVSIGIGVNFVAHISISFLTSIGNRNRRMSLCLQHMFRPVLNGILATLIGVSMLGFSEFDFIIRYFFYIMVAVVGIGTFNALILLPVLLSLWGPGSELIPLEHEDRISTPTPPPSPIMTTSVNISSNGIGPMATNYANTIPYSSHPTNGQSNKTKRNLIFPRYNRRNRCPPRVLSEISLSTISEESQSYKSSAANTPLPPTLNNHHHKSSSSTTSPPYCSAAASGQASSQSHEIVVQPEFVVETTITNNSPNNQFAATSVTPTSESASSDRSSITSPSPTGSDRDSPSGRSESAASSNGTQSRCSSAASFTTTTTTTSSNANSEQQQSNNSTTVTTKVMATTKLTIPVPQHHPPSIGHHPMFHHHHQTASMPTGIPLSAIFFSPPNSHHPHAMYHPHNHPTPEPCRTCLGCMTPTPGSVPPTPSYHYPSSRR